MSNQSLKAKKEAGARRFRRAHVGLKGALRIADLGVEIIHTKNISEGGIGLNMLGNCEFEIGSEVQLHLNGVLSGEDNPRVEAYAMKVIHRNGRHLGLSFI